jgi:methyl-accepting chemotaxis protein
MALKSVALKVVVGLVALVLLAAAGGGVIWWSAAQSNVVAQRFVDLRMPLALLLARIKGNLSDVELLTEKILVGTGAHSAETITALNAVRKELETDVDSLAAMAANFTREENRRRAAEVNRLVDAMMTTQTQIMAGIGDVAKRAETRATIEQADRVRLEAAKIINELLKSQQDILTAESQEVAERYGMTKAAIFSMLGLLGVASTIIVLVLRRSVIAPLAAVAQRADQIAKGDLSAQPLPVLTQDEAGRLTAAVNDMQAALRDIVGKARNAAMNVAASGQQIAAAAEELSHGADQQEAQIQNVSAAVTELTSSAESVANDTAKAAETARNTEKAGQNGSHLISQAVESMHRIREAVAATSGAIHSLSTKTDAIGGIVQIINDIADQTNLLALNAAIEAARAGEHGRGFAVVADEVRKLAERTTVATKQIVESITEVRTESDGAVKRVAEGITTVETGVKQTETVGTELQKVITQTSQLAAVVQTIAQAVEQQKAALQGINQSCTETSNVSRESTQATGDVAKAASSLTGRSAELTAIVGRFTLGTEDAPRARTTPANGGKPAGKPTATVEAARAALAKVRRAA